jgi:hypothetical protein
MSRSSTKTMLIVFFDNRGVVHREFVPQGQTVNKVLLRNSAAFEGEHSAKATGSVARERTGFSTTTMHPVIEHSSFVNFSPTTTCYHFRARPTRHI